MKTWSSVRQAVTATVLLVLASAAITSLTSIPAYANLCPLTQGFWKNHPSAWGPVMSLTLGGKFYTKTELIDILKTPPAGDASLILAHQLIAADLNIATGSVFFPDPIGGAILTANLLLSAVCGGVLPCNVAPSSPSGQAMVTVAAQLDQFNEGRLTPVCTPR